MQQQTVPTGKKYLSLILVLGSLTALGPFSIDMYLPGFPAIAADLQTTTALVSLSLSGYFVGISFGQLLYGPLMDRFGRKPPIYFGLTVYILASIACALTRSIELLIFWRVVQAIGSCAAGVGSMVLVRDLFPVEENAKVFSLLILVLGTSPMIAPTAGGYVTDLFGWQAVFIILAIMAAMMAVAVMFFLPDKYKPDPGFSLKPKPILGNFKIVLKEKKFLTYCFSGSAAFSGLFVYVSGSPQVFMEFFNLDGKLYGWIFAGLSVGFIGSSQVNTLLLKKFTSERIVITALTCQSILALIFLLCSLNGWMNLYSTIVFIFLYLCCLGLISPNTSALALAPFTKNTGSASAVLGAVQMTTGAIASTGVSLFHAQNTTPMVFMMCVASCTGLMFLLRGRKLMHSTVLIKS
jgi:DHA1 family bicyclomycin/chloramphenicol resistance-like MFS transporter